MNAMLALKSLYIISTEVKSHLRDEDWVDEVVRSQVCGTRLPVS